MPNQPPTRHGLSLPLLILACLVLVLAILLDWLGVSQAIAANPIETSPLLTDEDRTMLDLLGPGVVVGPLDQPGIEDIAPWYPLQNQKGSYQRTISGQSSKSVTVLLTHVDRYPHDPPGSSAGAWTLNTTNRDIKYFLLKDGDLMLPTEVNINQGVATIFDPPEPVLLAGLKTGESRTVESKIAVYDLHKPKDKKYTGTLKFIYADKGAWRVTVPAGTFDARLIVVTAEGKIGPGNIRSGYLVFYAKDVGRVAFVARRHVSAYLVYNKTTQHALVLEKMTPETTSLEPKKQTKEPKP
ncbi:MAG: hypothetical protein P8K80_06830 [Phycisphaerales bacterium]|nr:hypothetical protein [Phycisphaerales bacterium]